MFISAFSRMSLCRQISSWLAIAMRYHQNITYQLKPRPSKPPFLFRISLQWPGIGFIAMKSNSCSYPNSILRYALVVSTENGDKNRRCLLESHVITVVGC